MEVPYCGWGPWSCFGCFPYLIIIQSFKFLKNLSCLKVSRTVLKNDDTLLEFRRMWRFLPRLGSLIMFWMFFFDDHKLKFQIWKKKIRHVWRCQEPSWRMMTLCWSSGRPGGFWLGLGSMITFLICSLSFKFHKNLSCLKLSRTLLMNDETLLEFRRMWRFLTRAAVID